MGGPSTVLVTDDINGQNRGALATVRALAGTPYRAMVTVGERRSLAAASRHCAGVVPLPTGGSPGYAEALRSAVGAGRFAVFFPASDVALMAVGAPAATLVDKACLDGAARAAGFACLPTEVFDSAAALRAAAGRLPYPAVVKSVTKSGLGNLQAATVTSAAEVHALGDVPGRLLVQPFEGAPLRAVSGVVHGGRLLAVCHQEYHRIWPPQAGVASAAVTVAGDPATEERLGALLHMHSGVFQVQFLGDYLVDVNPRVYGSLALAVGAGANLPLIACRAAVGDEPAGLVRARPGVRYRWWEGEVRHLVAGLRSHRLGPRDALGVLRPRRGTVQSVESLTDPGPTLGRLVDVARRRAVRA